MTSDRPTSGYIHTHEIGNRAVTPEQVTDPRTPLSSMGVTPKLMRLVAGRPLSLSRAIRMAATPRGRAK